MKAFFGDTGAGHAAGVWESAHGVPAERPEFKAETRRQLLRLQKQRKAQEMV